MAEAADGVQTTVPADGPREVSPTPRHDDSPWGDDPTAELHELRDRIAESDEEVDVLRRRLPESPGRVQSLEERLLETKGQLAQAVSQNEKLTFTLQQAKEHIAALREEVDKLTQPPARLRDVPCTSTTTGRSTSSRAVARCGWRVHPEIDAIELRRGQEVVLNESLNVILAREGERLRRGRHPQGGARGPATRHRLRPCRRGAGGRAVRRSPRRASACRRRRADGSRDRSCWSRSCPGPRSRSSSSRRCPTSRTPTSAASTAQIEAITDAVELPYLHRDLFNEYKLPAPKGILLYGPPGCGKTLIAKAVANSLAKKVAEITGNANIRSYFLNIKGPELLNKYVGETERQIRLVFQRAREKAEEGVPVIVFFDEMDSLFRTRGTGISSDMESTIVPQLLAEIDGVETLRDVIVIGASNREDLIDPAILRPGRLDVKIKIERPDEEAATQIFSRYLTADLPIDAEEVERLGGGDPDKAVQAMIEATVAEMYRDDEDNRFLEVTYQNGDKEVLYYRDFASGAMIENIVRRAKKLAIKRAIAGEGAGIRTSGPLGVDPPGVQGERGSPQHHQPRRLGADLGQEGGADRVRADPAGRHRGDPGRPFHRAGGYRPVPLSGDDPGRRRPRRAATH